MQMTQFEEQPNSATLQSAKMTNRILAGWGYEVGRTIGEGTYSKVKLATSQKHGCKVAIKIFNLKTAPPDFVKKFLPRELEILKTVKHDHIIHVHECIELPGKLCIVMESAETDLLTKIREVGRFPVDQSRAMFAQIVSAVSYLHQNNIVHRDLKCDNVLLMEDNQVKITDFGFGRTTVGFPELSNTYCGTVAYSPPEVLLGIPYDPQKHDIWAIGVILYVMVTGRMPYNDSNIAKLTKAQRKPLRYPDEVVLAESCRAFISFLLHTDPSTRPSIQQVVEHSWLQKDGDHKV